jgi:hypothetical protein
MSVGYCRGEEGNDDRLDRAPSEDDLSVKRFRHGLANCLEIPSNKFKVAKTAETVPNEGGGMIVQSDWSGASDPVIVPAARVLVVAMGAGFGGAHLLRQGPPNAEAEWLFPWPGTLHNLRKTRLSIGGSDDLEA